MYCILYILQPLVQLHLSFKAFAGLQGVKRGQHNFVLEATAGLLSIVQWTFMLVLPLIQVRYTLYKHVCMLLLDTLLYSMDFTGYTIYKVQQELAYI